jgi:methyl-accepting chemotaxis protein
MIGPFFLAQTASTIDAVASGGSLTGLIGSLGAAGAAVIVTFYFLSFLKDQGEKQGRMYQDFKDSHTVSEQKFQDQMDRLTDRHMQSQRTFQDQIGRITDEQSTLLRDAALAMKSVEKTLDSAAETTRGIEKTTASLKTSLTAIDDLVRMANEAGTGRSAPPGAAPHRKPASL